MIFLDADAGGGGMLSTGIVGVGQQRLSTMMENNDSSDNTPPVMKGKYNQDVVMLK